MSDFHPESWNPLWSVGTILSVSHAAIPHHSTDAHTIAAPDCFIVVKYMTETLLHQGLQSFMTEDSDAVGSMRSSAAQRAAFAIDSLRFNLRDKSDRPSLALLPAAPPLTRTRMFSSLFSEQVPQWRQQLEERAKNSGTPLHSPHASLRALVHSEAAALNGASIHFSSAGVVEVPDVQAAAGASSYFAIFFTFSVASAVLYIALTSVAPFSPCCLAALTRLALILRTVLFVS
jgi:hypothetical protein